MAFPPPRPDSFFFNDTATTEIYTLSLHDALPIYRKPSTSTPRTNLHAKVPLHALRSEEHTSELQSLRHLVCRLLLEKNKQYADAPSPQHTHYRHRVLPGRRPRA